jgi:hypothetical protein
MNRHLNNEGQERKTDCVKGRVTVEEEGKMKRVKGDKYG